MLTLKGVLISDSKDKKVTCVTVPDIQGLPSVKGDYVSVLVTLAASYVLFCELFRSFGDSGSFICSLCTIGCLALSVSQASLVKLARKNTGVIVPGYTHLQRTQPVLVKHHLLEYIEQVRISILTNLKRVAAAAILSKS